MKNSSFLTSEIFEQSISIEEIVLPLSVALKAIDLLEKNNVLILGWEGWVRKSDGSVGHDLSTPGTEGLDSLSIRDAAELCRFTIQEDAKAWESKHKDSGKDLFFCITVST